MSDIYDVIQSFADGEPVDPMELEAALADPDGRAHLVDIAVLRKLVKGTTAVASMPTGAGRTVRHPIRWLAAAAMVVMSASAGGYFLGERASSGLGPAALNQPAVIDTTGSVAPIPPAPAPAPTKVITFQPGVDWTERGGY
jgi:hypothetical protein